MSVVHPALPSYQFGCFLRQGPSDAELRSQGVKKPHPRSAPPSLATALSTASRFASPHDLLAMRAPSHLNGTRTIYTNPKAGTHRPVRYVNLPGPLRGSEIKVRTMHTWVPRTMPPMFTREGPTPILGGQSPVSAWGKLVVLPGR
ncbi:MAG: hypothetical protein SGPRY_009409 [Prymnesium sp.]